MPDWLRNAQKYVKPITLSSVIGRDLKSHKGGSGFSRIHVAVAVAVGFEFDFRFSILIFDDFACVTFRSAQFMAEMSSRYEDEARQAARRGRGKQADGGEEVNQSCLLS